jgi:hypothetical protein
VPHHRHQQDDDQQNANYRADVAHRPSPARPDSPLTEELQSARRVELR